HVKRATLDIHVSAPERRVMIHVVRSRRAQARLGTLIGVLAGALLFAGWAHAATIPVSTTAQLQAAVASAAAGDTISLAPGSYAPDAPLTVNQNNLTITGPDTAPGARINGSNVASIAGAPPDLFDVNGNGFTLKNVALQQTANNGTVLNLIGSGATLTNSSVSANNGLSIWATFGTTLSIINSTV